MGTQKKNKGLFSCSSNMGLNKTPLLFFIFFFLKIEKKIKIICWFRIEKKIKKKKENKTVACAYSRT